MATISEAKDIVERISIRYGYLRESLMDEVEKKLSLDARREIDGVRLALETTAAHSVKTLAKEIYGSGARFVFELLQNADDNTFKRAKKINAPPFILFKVYADRIVIDCNEDGFESRHVKAICEVGDSTKSTSYGYTGAKGIGFKSVFIAAWRVYIQSGNFSFEFRHKKSESGLGMVRPIWVDASETLDGPLTRMTLYLHEEGDRSEVGHLQDVIFRQLGDLQNNCLLFLRRLERIGVEFYDKNGHLKTSRHIQKQKIDDHRVSVEEISTEDGEETFTSQIYHLTRKGATGLTASDNRQVPDTDDARLAFAKADVVLAFPLTDEYKPLISQGQDVFAFLPVRQLDYKFIIHSDFDTSANRQDIVETSRRNLDLLDWIAKTFVDAILQFNQDETLDCEWPLFLPSTKHSSSWFWAGLNRRILEHVGKTPTVKSRRWTDLRLIHHVLFLTDDWRYGDGLPLLDDEASDPFLSPRYPQKSVDILFEYGLKRLGSDLQLALLEKDVGSFNSIMQATGTDEEWHTAMASCLSSIAAKDMPAARRMKSLPLLPLSTGLWASTISGPVYLPRAGGFNIPSHVSLRVIKPKALWNEARKVLFERLGVSEALVIIVRASIYEAFRITRPGQYHSDYNYYCRYLYFTHNSQPHSELCQIMVVCSAGKRVDPHVTDVYFSKADDPYGAKALLAPNDTAPGMPVSFLHDVFLATPLPRPSQDHPSWKGWLRRSVGIRQQLRLTTKDGKALSDAFLYVFQHRKDKFVGLLGHLWLSEGSKMRENKNLCRSVEDLDAQELCGVDYQLRLRDTWLPKPHLLSAVRRYMEHPEHFPFLKLDGAEVTGPSAMKCDFLRVYLSVGGQDDIDFSLEILRCIVKYCPAPLSVSQSQRVLDLYVVIDAKLLLVGDQPAKRKQIRDFFNSLAILIPEGEHTTWASSAECVWHGPPDMMHKHPLRSIYSRMLGDEQMKSVKHFFSSFLELPAASLFDVVEELKDLSSNHSKGLEIATDMYTYLSCLDISTVELRTEFARVPLIYARANEEESWHKYKPSECLWSSTTEIRGRVALDHLYEELENFFVERLGVKSLTLQMVYDELLQGPEQLRFRFQKARDLILSFNSLLQSEPIPLDPRPLLDANIFPVRFANGAGKFCSAKRDFAIGDRQYLRECFEGQIQVLSFNLEEVRVLSPFFKWAGLERRYLSASVTERTILAENSSRPISMENRDLRRKAYYILRVAATFNAPRYQADPNDLYQQLRRVKVLETDGISSTLEIVQKGRLFSSPGLSGTEHFVEDPSGLTIYVPRKRRAQEICFGTVLPLKLAKWLMGIQESLRGETVDDEAVKVLALVLAYDRSVLDEILDREGMIEVSVENEETDDDSDIDDGQSSGWGVPSPEAPHLAIGRQMTPTPSSSSSVTLDPGLPSQMARFGLQNSGRGVSYESIALQSQMSRDSRSQGGSTVPPLSLFGGQYSGRGSPLTPSVGFGQSSQGRSTVAPLSLFGGQYSSRGSPLTPSVGFGQSSSQPPSLPPNVFSQPPSVRGSPVAPTTMSLEDEAYKTILEITVTAAQGAIFPSRGSFDMSDMRIALEEQEPDEVERYDGSDVVTRFRSSSQFERDKKIGAAGELYVFELLTKLQLPMFNEGCWQSKIKDYAKLLEKYVHLQSWGHKETADIVYQDSEGRFTEVLVDCGYLDREKWAGAQPKYYIEVKTTTGPLATRFYMSTNQYNLMREVHEKRDCSEVYLICRVYLLNSPAVKMSVFVNPEQLRRDKHLLFTGHTWSVVPSSS